MIGRRGAPQGQFVAGANRTGWHCAASRPAATTEARFADIRQTREGDACPSAAGRSASRPRSRSATSSSSARATRSRWGRPFLDEDGAERALVMGSYGIGLGRVIAAAVEQHPDERGIAWPAEIAPYDVHVVVLRPGRGDRGPDGGLAAGARGSGPRRAARRPRPAPGREVRRRRSDRRARARHGGQEDARGRRSRRRRARRARRSGSRVRRRKTGVRR